MGISITLKSYTAEREIFSTQRAMYDEIYENGNHVVVKLGIVLDIYVTFQFGTLNCSTYEYTCICMYRNNAYS